VPNPLTSMPVVGMVGGGQLARMTHQASIALGVHFRVLCDIPDDSAAQVAADSVVGDFRNFDDLEAFARGCDVVTFDHEHVPLRHVEKLVEAGVRVYPGPQALPYVQDKIRMRERLGSLGFPVPAWAIVENASAVEEFAASYGWPVVIKAASGGYDGKGVWVVRSKADAERLLGAPSGITFFAERHVPFRRELAALVARTPSGASRAFPVVETVQDDGICVEVVAPAPGLSAGLARRAQELALGIAEQLDVVGLLAVEIFEADAENPLVVNELAMRPHNSGHWTIDGCRTSQFGQHVRAVLDWPLGDTSLVAPATVMANLLGGTGPRAADLGSRVPLALSDPDVRLHLYGKGVRPGRKIGHVNISGDDVTDLRARARRAVDILRGDAQ
jgi:5-(carboxyamino)imidazole ribonucleotide synthase